MARTTSQLGIDRADVRRARTLARQVGKPIVELATRHTTVSVERATLRLAGTATPASPATVAEARSTTAAGPRWPWFLAWLLAAAALWWLERAARRS